MYIFVVEPSLRMYLPSNVLLGTNHQPDNQHSIYESLYAFDDGYEYDPNDPLTRQHEEKLLRALNITDENGRMYTVDDGDSITELGNCSTPEGFKIHILGHRPLVIYIENFVSEEEADHLVRKRCVFYSLLLLSLFEKIKRDYGSI